MKRKILFIVNPISGTSSKQHILDYIEQSISTELFEWEIAKTAYKGNASVLASEAAEKGIDLVVAIGGDGTVNEVARSLVHTNTALGIIPCGSGNGLARHLEIPMDFKKAVDLINTGIVRTLDYGTINDLPFFCTCGVGFDAFVSFKFAEAGKRGLLTYLENTLKEGLRYKPETYEIEDEEGTIKTKAFLIACANASQYGNNAYIAPAASMEDGLLDVTIMEPFTVLEAPQIAFQLFNKTLDQNSHIKTFKTKQLHIHRVSEGVVHYDGDPMMMGSDIDIKSIPAGFRALVHKEALLDRKETLLSIFSEYFNDISNFAEDRISLMQKKNLVVNKELLRKLTKNNHKLEGSQKVESGESDLLDAEKFAAETIIPEPTEPKE